jgi:hypothetical protein
MIKTVNLNNQEAPNKWWAARDARMRNFANASHYTDNQRLAAERMKLVLEMVYHNRGVFIAYGKTGISLKVNDAVVRDRKELGLMEAGWSIVGYTKKTTPQGVIYRFQKS